MHLVSIDVVSINLCGVIVNMRAAGQLAIFTNFEIFIIQQVGELKTMFCIVNDNVILLFDLLPHHREMHLNNFFSSSAAILFLLSEFCILSLSINPAVIKFELAMNNTLQLVASKST